ncbi:expressed unknown protein [Seminavis robusta]|uniref:RING-type domain-containing protein n=1 Tax=Seminavis robusta TaxID=568900 RepID=A0A9N8F5J3_9STRA|nr:expressed unknown protein [Seminavis robusta]|eukprot:Sro3398_g347580.1 n/a (280) ;mRNA; f:3343-4588
MSIFKNNNNLLRGLEDEEVFFVNDDKYAEYAKVQDSEDEEDGSEFPLWAAMLSLAAFAILLTAVVFYISYKQEWCCGVHNKKEAEDVEEGETKKIPTKTFQDSTRFERLTPSVAFQEGEEYSQTIKSEGSDSLNNIDASKQNARASNTTVSSSTSSNSNRASNSIRASTATTRSSNVASIRQSVITPRCVLCSKKYQIGEPVTHSSNPECHHEYHEACLTKHWAKAKGDKKDKCPVCKEVYVVESLSPSQHFSTLELNKRQSGTSMRDSSMKEMEPFAE